MSTKSNPQNKVSPTDEGQRVSFQFILPNGHVNEIVGTFEYYDKGADAYMVRDRSGELQRVNARDVRAGRVVS